MGANTGANKLRREQRL